MPKFDGTEKFSPTPFDAHEQVVRDSSGYKRQEYPKAVAHDPETGEPVIAKDAKHEAKLKGKKA